MNIFALEIAKKISHLVDLDSHRNIKAQIKAQHGGEIYVIPAVRHSILFSAARLLKAAIVTRLV